MVVREKESQALGETVGTNGDEGEENGKAQSKLMPCNHTHRGDRADEICRRID
jgi:hypothetical protein